MSKSNTPLPLRGLDALQTRFARRVAARLEEAARATPPDVDERLRFARERALARARELRESSAVVTASAIGGGTLGWTRGGASWWVRLASVLPLVLLIAGLTLIQQRHWSEQVEAAAEIDAAILTDDLPPAAYTDPGFAEYLRVTE